MSISRRTALALPLAALAVPEPSSSIDDILAAVAQVDKLFEDVVIDPRNVAWLEPGLQERYIREVLEPLRASEKKHHSD